jgi:cytidine deaminase
MTRKHQNLIDLAKQATGYKELTKDVAMGKVACVLRTKSGKIYTGVSVTSSVNLGWCAEISALSQMINDDETQVEVIVGVSDDGKIIPPCGRCREFMYQLNRKNLQAKVLFPGGKTMTLEELLPERWQEHWVGRE